MTVYTDQKIIKKVRFPHEEHQKKPNLKEKLKNLKVIYTTPVKFVNYQLCYNDEYILPPEFLEILVKKLFTEEKYKPLLKEVKEMAEK